MKTEFSFLLSIFISITPAFALGDLSNNGAIYSSSAVSQTGRFTLNYYSPLTIDKNRSLTLTSFIAYHAANANTKILIGAISGDENLAAVCKNPKFLKNENIAAISSMTNSDIQYFNTKSYKGCIINLDKNKSAIVVEIPQPFISQDGDKINHVGLVGNNGIISTLKHNISFQITAQDYYINLLQLSQTFSPFSKEIDWKNIKNQGLEFIGTETKTCRGLSAAVKYLIPPLRQHDFHSFISLKGLGTPSCPSAPIVEDDGLKRWLSVPKQTRNTIVKYTSDFHGYKLNKHIAYLYIPAIEAYDPDTINNKIKIGRAAIKKANADQSCGLIVDLRFNLGGSLQSMLLTLGNIIPSGKLFSLGKGSPIYLSDDGNNLFINPSRDFYGKYDGAISKKFRNIPIAILTNWMTASSGVLTSLALRDNSNVAKVFGTKTSPTASANTTFYLLDGNTLNLMIDRVYNKQDKMVPLNLSVDEEIEDNLQTIFDPNADMALIAARDWLESLPMCNNYESS